MGHDSVLTVFVILAAAAFLTQAVVMLFLYFSLRDLPEKVEAIRLDVKQRLDPLTESVTEIVASSREPVRAITANLAEISRMLRDRTSQVDGLVADLVDKTRLQAARMDQTVGDMLRKVETTAELVQRQVLAPIQEISAVMKGVRSGLQVLFSRRRAPDASEARADERLFI